MNLKDNIKSQRIKSGMTLEELAQKVGVSRQTIQRYESGVISNIPSDNIEKIADALDTTPANLMGWNNNGNSSPTNNVGDTEIKTSTLTEQDEKDITKIIEKMRERLTRNDLIFEGKLVSTEDIESILAALQIGMEMARKRINDKK